MASWAESTIWPDISRSRLNRHPSSRQPRRHCSVANRHRRMQHLTEISIQCRSWDAPGSDRHTSQIFPGGQTGDWEMLETNARRQGQAEPPLDEAPLDRASPARRQMHVSNLCPLAASLIRQTRGTLTGWMAGHLLILP